MLALVNSFPCSIGAFPLQITDPRLCGYLENLENSNFLKVFSIRYVKTFYPKIYFCENAVFPSIFVIKTCEISCLMEVQLMTPSAWVTQQDFKIEIFKT